MKNLITKFAVCFIALSTAATAYAGKITVKGSDTMVILGQKWAEVYRQKNPVTEIQVNGGGTGTGLAALINKSTDIANASRPMKAKEQGDFVKTYNTRPREYKVALDGL